MEQLKDVLKSNVLFWDLLIILFSNTFQFQHASQLEPLWEPHWIISGDWWMSRNMMLVTSEHHQCGVCLSVRVKKCVGVERKMTRFFVIPKSILDETNSQFHTMTTPQMYKATDKCTHVQITLNDKLFTGQVWQTISPSVNHVPYHEFFFVWAFFLQNMHTMPKFWRLCYARCTAQGWVTEQTLKITSCQVYDMRCVDESIFQNILKIQKKSCWCWNNAC